MFSLKVEINHPVSDDEVDNEDEEEQFYAKIAVYQKKNETEYLVCLFTVFDECELDVINKKGLKVVSFLMDNADIRIVLKNNEFTTSLSSYGKGNSTNIYYLDEQENRQFTEELMKFF